MCSLPCAEGSLLPTDGRSALRRSAASPIERDRRSTDSAETWQSSRSGFGQRVECPGEAVPDDGVGRPGRQHLPRRSQSCTTGSRLFLHASIFGPVLVAIRWTDEQDVIRMSNDSHYGLAAYVWTHDIGKALRTAHAIEAGWVQVNQGLGQSPGHSYGGYKESGIGREFSLEGMLESYTQRKNVTINLTH